MRSVVLIFILTIFALPSLAATWITTGKTQAYTFAGTSDPTSAADMTICDFDTAMVNINRDFGATVGEDNDAAAVLHQCQDSTDTIGSAGCSDDPVREWVTAVGPSTTGFDTWLDLNKGRYFRMDITTGPGGSGSGHVAIVCTADRTAGQISLISEIYHGNLTAGTEYRVEPNPYRAGLYFHMGTSALTPAYVFNEDGGLGAFASSTSAGLGIKVSPGETILVPGNSPLVFGTPTGASATAGIRVLEAVASRDSGASPPMSLSYKRSKDPSPNIIGFSSTAVDATYAVSTDHVFFHTNSKKITCNAPAANTQNVRIGTLVAAPTSGVGFALLPGDSVIFEWPLFVPAFISDSGTQTITCLSEQW